MPNPLAIHMREVSKIYQLYGSQRDQLIGVLGLQRIGIRPRSTPKEFAALSDITLSVPRGKRIGIIGRNGAGKTTLLKLVCGNFVPTRGTVEVNGTVQALMSAGIGFHPEYTGHENILGALQYNGLSRSAYKDAVDGIVEFCELGDFLDQPVKTYSLGMQARLMFATATAIQPDILIVDEILGAGDAYFVAKSKHRVQKLVGSGCTMLLVSHSMQQVLELCEDVIWLDGGRIRMRGEAFLVVKAYEEHLQTAVHASKFKSESDATASGVAVDDSATPIEAPMRSFIWSQQKMQEPVFVPHEGNPTIPQLPAKYLREFHGAAPGGISRWPSDPGVKICGFATMTEAGVSSVLHALRPCKIVLTLEVEKSDSYALRYGIVIDDPLGRSAARIYSACDRFNGVEGQLRVVELLFNPLQLGPSEYTIGISVLEYGALEAINSAKRYDLLGRSFRIEVRLAETLSAVQASALLTGQWRFASA